MNLTAVSLSKLKYLKTQANVNILLNNGGVNETIAKRLNDSIIYIGRIKITSGVRPNDLKSFHSKGMAIDFQLLQKPLYHVYQILRAIGWKRIGVFPAGNSIHIDIASGAYFFLEIAQNGRGKDAGPLADKPQQVLASIPGFTSPIDTTGIRTKFIGDTVTPYLFASLAVGIPLYFFKPQKV